MRARLGLAVVLGALGAAFLRPDVPAVAADRPAPAFDLETIAPAVGPKPRAKRISSATIKGKVVLFNFWATWCPPCRHEIPDLIRLHDELKAKGFTVLGVSLDDQPQLLVPGFTRDFAAKEHVSFTYPLLEGNEKVAQAFGGIRGIPTTFLIDRKGVIRQKWIGPPGDSHEDILTNFHKAIDPLL